MRTENSIKNIFWTGIAYFINVIVNFVARKLFIVFLGIEYNGINSLFSSVISMLSIAELGFGTAILFELYKPVSDNNHEKVKSLLAFYRKCYTIIAGVVFLIGILLIPFLDEIVGTVNVPVNIVAVYILVLLDTSFSYLLTYKRSILIVNQQERVLKKIHIGYIIIYNFLEIIILYFTKNYYLYLIIKLFSTIAENLMISKIASKKYPYINEESKPLNQTTKKAIYKKIKALFFHKVAGFVVNGTDNILISLMFGVVMVGYYNNYFLIVTSVVTLASNLFTVLTPSVGNLLTTSSSEKNYSVFKNIHFINFCVAAFCTTCLAVLTQPFVELWLGEEYLLPNSILYTLVVYFYFRIMKFSISIFKDAAGIYYEDRYVPILEAVSNIVFSVLFAKYFGVAGIILGTIASTLILYLFSYPVYVYKRLFQKTYFQYIKEIGIYGITTILITGIAILLNNFIHFESSILELIKGGIITLIVFSIIVLWFFHKRDEFVFLKNIGKKIKNKGSI